MLADGRLHLTGLSLIAGRLTDDNHHQLLEQATGKTKAEILIVLARWFPKLAAPDRVEPVASGPSASSSGRGASGGMDGSDGPMGGPRFGCGGWVGADAPRPGVEPLSEDRFAVHFSGSAPLKEKLEHAQNLMSHVSRKLEVVFGRALDALICALENKRWGKPNRPRRSRAAKNCSG